MAVPVQVDLNPNTRKVEAALARIKAQAKGVNLGGGAESINKLSRPLGKITGQASEFQKSLEASNARVLAFGASVAVINKLSQAFGALVANTIKVEASFAKINTILGGTKKELEQFGNGIFKVAQQTGTSFDQVAEGALELARQGLSVEESLNRVSTSLKLVRVSGIDAEKSVAGLTAAIKGFEGAGLTVAQIADKLAEVDTKFAVSTEDLINGLERASASARVAGVSFDELLGVVTTVQERTQRGGAVIGNAFKTIFARLSRTDTLQALDQLGIEVLDVQGNVRGAIPLFQDLAVELDKIGLQTVKAGDIIQKVAGVRQRDILISLIEDLNSGQSQFAKALQVSAGAAGALDAKNAQLNNTLEALINNLTVGGQKLASVLGEIGFTDAAKDILKIFSSVVNSITDILQGDSIGAKFAQGLIKGIGSILTGPGLALITAIFIKLFVDLAKFGATSLKQILGINKAAAQQATLQQSVLQTLLQNENIQREILALEGNKVAQEQLLLKIYNQQAAALAKVQKAAATVTPGLFGAGLRGGEGGVKPRGKASGGYIAAEARDVSRGVGGAPASSKVVSIPNFAFGGGKRGTMVANTSEYIVPNFAGGGDAIFNRDMVRSMGLPAGARKINAAGGYIPNFARNIYISRGASTEQIQKKAAAGDKDAIAALAIRRNKAKKATSDFRFNAGGRIGVLSAFKGSSSTVATEKFGQLSPVERGIFESVVGQDIKKPSTTISISGIQTKSLENIDRSRVSRFRKNIDSLFAPSLIEFAKSLIGGVGIKNDEFSQFSQIINKSKGNLFSTSVEGGIFESAIQLGTRSLKNISDFLSSTGDEQSPFDFEEGAEPASSLLKKSFGFNQGLIKADAKRTASSKSVNTLIGKSLRDSLVRGKIFKKAASGYIPNFAGGALEEAIGREQAAGLPINQIRINQSGKLRNAKNPMGLAVTNTRDEPTGAIPNFARYPIGTGTRFATGGGRERDSVESLSQSAGKASAALDNSIGKIFALQFAISGLTNSMTEQDGVYNKIGNELTGLVNTLLTLQLVGAAPKIPGLGKRASAAFPALATGFSLLSKNFIKFIPYVGTAILAFQGINGILKTFTGKGIFERLGFSAEKAADKLNEVANAGKPDDKPREVSEIQREREGLIDQRDIILNYLEGAGDIPQSIRVALFRDDPQKAAERVAELSEKIAALGEESKKSANYAASVVSSQKAATATSLAFSRRQNLIEIESAKAAARTEREQRRPMGSVSKAVFSIEEERQTKEKEAKISRLQIRESLVKQIRLQDSVSDIQKEQLDIILSQANEYGSIEKIAGAINTIEGLSIDNFSEIVRQAKLQNTQLDDTVEKDQKILNIRKNQAIETAKANIGLAKYSSDTEQKLIDQAENLPNVLAQNIEQSMANTFDKLATGAYDSIGDAFLNIALDFGRELQRQISQRAAASITNSLFGSGTAGGGFLGGLSKAVGFNSGGFVSGGSGVRDDIPAKLTGGEYVIKKSAVQKYGVDFLDRLNSKGISQMQSGGFFVPGTRGQGTIKGKENLLAFANQEFTSGATDIITSSGSGAFIDLEDQSARLTTFGRFRESPARRALKDAQNQALDLYNQQIEEENRIKEARKERSRQLRSGILGSFVSAGVSALGGKLGSLFNKEKTPPTPSTSVNSPTSFSGSSGYNLYGSSFGFANGGMASGRSNALLMGGEYVVSAPAAAQIGRRNLDNINMMNFSNGGAVGNTASSSGETTSADIGEVNITINMEKGDATVENSSKEGGDITQTKEFAKKIKDVVVGVINEEKRVSGSLFSRRK